MNPMGQSDCKPTTGCRSCGASLSRVFVDLGMSPLANRFLAPGELLQTEPFFPLVVYVCEHCFLVQLPAVETPERIFRDYPYFSSLSDSWLAHAKTYVEMAIERFGLNHRSRVIEIASNDGYLLQYFVARGIPVLGIEPAENVAAVAIRRGIPTEVDFFGQRKAQQLVTQGRAVDLVVANNVLAHVPDLNDFVRGLKTILKPQGVLTIEFPHLMRLMEENQFDTIYHEHFSYFSFFAAERVLASHGLRVFDVEALPTHGGSLRLYAGHAEDSSKASSSRVAALRQQEEAAGLTRLATYLGFGSKVQETKRKLLGFLIAAKQAGKTIVAYGAAAKGNTLLNYCGIRSDFIDYAVDRSDAKRGHFLPGTHIPVHCPDKIKETKPDYVLILPWNLKGEIMGQMAYIRDWGGQFVVPIPEVRVFP